jgi:hypothetical protein
MISIPKSIHNHVNLTDDEIHGYYSLTPVDEDYEIHSKRLNKVLNEYVNTKEFKTPNAKASFKSQIKRMIKNGETHTAKYEAFNNWRLRKIHFYISKQKDWLLEMEKNNSQPVMDPIQKDEEIERLKKLLEEKDKIIEEKDKEIESLKAGKVIVEEEPTEDPYQALYDDSDYSDDEEEEEEVIIEKPKIQPKKPKKIEVKKIDEKEEIKMIKEVYEKTKPVIVDEYVNDNAIDKFCYNYDYSQHLEEYEEGEYSLNEIVDKIFSQLLKKVGTIKKQSQRNSIIKFIKDELEENDIC